MNLVSKNKVQALKLSCINNSIYRYLIAVMVMFLSLPTLCAAATYYISPAGSDEANGVEKVSAWKTFAYAFSKLTPGDTLILVNGTYHEPLRPTVSGSAGKPITLKAETVGGAIIEMQVDGAAIEIYSDTRKTISYITIEGVIARGHGEYSAIDIFSSDSVSEPQMTNNIIIRSTGAFGSANLSNSKVISLGNNLRDSLFEDIWAYGYGRKAMQAFGCLRVTIRRAVLRYDYWDGAGYKPNDPRVTFSGYNTQDSIFENIIALDSAPTPPGRSSDRAGIVASGNQTPAIISGSRNNKYLGIISLNNVGNGFEVNGGTGDSTKGIYFKDIISWHNSANGFNIQGNDDGSYIVNSLFGKCGKAGLRLNPYPSYPIVNAVIRNCFAYYNSGSGYYYGVNQVVQFLNNTGVGNANSGLEPEYAPELKYIVKPAGVANYERGATITHRYIDGQLSTTQALWPWPYENVIKDCMCDPEDLKVVKRVAESGEGWEPGWCKSNKTLTQYIWEYLGQPIPSEIYGAQNSGCGAPPDATPNTRIE